MSSWDQRAIVSVSFSPAMMSLLYQQVEKSQRNALRLPVFESATQPPSLTLRPNF